MNLRARLNRLSSHRGIQGKRLEVTCIFIRGVFAVDRETGEVTGEDTATAWVWTSGGWETVTREIGETEADFIDRIDRMDSMGPSG